MNTIPHDGHRDVAELLDVQFLALPQDMKVSVAIRTIRSRRKDEFNYVYVIDRDSRLVGVLNMRQLLIAEPDDPLESIMIRDVAAVPAKTTVDRLPGLMKTHRFVALPVIDSGGRLLGTITHKTMLSVAEAEASDDIQTIFGAGGDEEALSPVGYSIRKRLPWLIINLFTAFLAAATVGIFEQTIAQITALAVLLPIVAGQGGNAGAQSLAVVIRGLALGQIGTGQMTRLVLKEVWGGFINGMVVAVVTFGAAWLWSRNLHVSTAIGLAMVLTMVMATLSGALIPVMLRRLGRDPAQASSIILTTVTDVVGFLSFLGLAALLIHQQ